MKRWAARILIAVVVLFIAVVALLYFRQHDLVYHPRPYRDQWAASVPAGVVELRYRTVAGNQSAFYVPRGADQNVPERLWIAFGGNGSLALEWLGFIARDRNE